jgi:hypothetical protein
MRRGGSFVWCVKDEEAGCGDVDGGNCFAHWWDEVLFCEVLFWRDKVRFKDLERMGEFVVCIRGVCAGEDAACPDDSENEGWIDDAVE